MRTEILSSSKGSIPSRIVATALAAALILTAPGLPLYQALAANLVGAPEGVSVSAGSAVSVVAAQNGGLQSGTRVESGYNGLGRRGGARFSPRGVQLRHSLPRPSSREREEGAAISPLPFTGEGQGERVPRQASPFVRSAPGYLPGNGVAPGSDDEAQAVSQAKQGTIRSRVQRLMQYFGASAPGSVPVAAPKVQEGRPGDGAEAEVVGGEFSAAAPETGPPAAEDKSGKDGKAAPAPSPLPAERGEGGRRPGEGLRQSVKGSVSSVRKAWAKTKGIISPTPEKSVWWFLGGLLVAQVGIEALGIAMPMMMRERFGGFSAMAQIAVFSSLAGMVGRLTGGGVADKLGLKTTYIGATVVRLLSISTMILFLLGPGALPGAAAWMVAHAAAFGFAGPALAALASYAAPALGAVDAFLKLKGFFDLKPFLALVGFYSFNGFMGGIALTAEMTLPQAMLGQHRAVLERFFALEQWLMETVGFSGPKIGGKIIEHHGFIPALLVYPVTFAIAIGLFIFGIRLPEKGEQPPAAAPQPAAVPDTQQPGFFKRVGQGAAIVFRNPVMRTAFLGYTAYMILNPLLYSIIGPAFGLLIAHGNALAGSDVASWVTALYSLGGLIGGLIMWREGSLLQQAKEGSQGPRKGVLRWLTRPIDFVVLRAYLGDWLGAAARKDGKLSDEGEKQILKKSTLLWMMLGTVGLGSFGTMLLPTAMPAYGAMILFGIAQVIANLKLRTIVMSEAPEADRTKVNGFLGAASTGLIALMLNMTGSLFDAFTGSTPFWYLNGSLIGMAATYVWLIQTYQRHSEAPGTEPGLKMRALSIVLGLMYAGLGGYAVYMIGHGIYGIIVHHGPAILAWLGSLLDSAAAHVPVLDWFHWVSANVTFAPWW